MPERIELYTVGCHVGDPMQPLVSVLIDTYNHERFIEEAIRSVIAQDFPRSQMEILVVDDGSTDRTPDIVREFEPRVRLLRKSNGGQASAINFGISHSTGEFVAFLDGDDVWLPNKLSRVIAEFQRHPEAVLVFHKFSSWDARDGREWEVEQSFDSGDILADRRKLFAYWAAPTSSLVFRRAVLEKIGPVPEQCSFNHDAYLTTAAIFLGQVAAIPECLTKNRVHGGNLYFGGKSGPNAETLQRRIEVREACIKAIRAWMYANAPKSARAEVMFLVKKFRLCQDADKFLLQPPGRLRLFAHLAQVNLAFGTAMTRAHLAYSWAHAFATLAFGRHAHYLEGVRTRLNKLRSRWQRRPSAGPADGTAERAS